MRQGSFSYFVDASPGGLAPSTEQRLAAMVNLQGGKAALEKDLVAAASALASVKTEITASEIEQINEILGLNSQTTSLTTDDIFKGVREIANRQ